MTSDGEDQEFDALLEATVGYLRKIGVDPMVVGGVAIRHEVTERQYNHELVVRFTAKLPDRLEQSSE